MIHVNQSVYIIGRHDRPNIMDRVNHLVFMIDYNQNYESVYETVILQPVLDLTSSMETPSAICCMIHP